MVIADLTLKVKNMPLEYTPCKTSQAKPGDIFGRLTVTSTIRRGDRVYAVCDCTCGTIGYKSRIDSMSCGNTQSCGCIGKEKFTTHGLSQHRLYNTWKDMMYRCYLPKSKSFKDYGGRGIAVCERWQDIRNFVTDMYPTHQDGLLLDRRDNEQGYSPENCRWVGWDVQSVNKRGVTLITHDGRSKTLGQWCKEYDIKHVTAVARIKKQGWDAVRAFTTPVDPNYRVTRLSR